MEVGYLDVKCISRCSGYGQMDGSQNKVMKFSTVIKGEDIPDYLTNS
jgi:hypothetical protein